MRMPWSKSNGLQLDLLNAPTVAESAAALAAPTTA
jgi:hypothetical protein